MCNNSIRRARSTVATENSGVVTIKWHFIRLNKLQDFFDWWYLGSFFSVKIPRYSNQKYSSFMQLIHREKNRNTEFSYVYFKERYYLEERGVDGRIILKWMLIVWEVLVQDKVYPVDCSEYGDEASSYMKICEIFDKLFNYQLFRKDHSSLDLGTSRILLNPYIIISPHSFRR
jgi:hypothetical protein